jgi:hypothetical protein
LRTEVSVGFGFFVEDGAGDDVWGAGVVVGVVVEVVGLVFFGVVVPAGAASLGLVRDLTRSA